MRDRSGYTRKYLWLLAFGAAMGLMEAIIVVYLRALFYPEGFQFPLKDMPPLLFTCEWLREVCTVVMLTAIAFLSGRTKLDRFSFFIFSFAVWDIFYYVGLKWLLGWPDSLLAWDILFLIPVPWLGPVLAPVLCSMGMIGLAVLISWLQEKKGLQSFRWNEWAFLLAGSFIIFLSFIWDYSKLIIGNGFLAKLPTLGTNAEFKTIVARFTPTHYLWWLFFVGALIICVGISNMFRRSIIQPRSLS